MSDSTSSQERILVIKLGALGDFVQALGAMAAIRNHHKNAHITLLTTAPYQSLARRSNYFNNICIDKKPKALDFKGWLDLRKTLITGNFSRIYDLQNNDRTAIYHKLFPRKQKPEWVGAAKGASHRNKSPERTKGTAFKGHKQTLALAGIKNITIDDMRWIKEDLSAFNLKKPFVLLVPGGSPQHPEKRWPVEHYCEIANYLALKNYQSVILGTDSEKDITATIKSACPESLNLTGKTNLFQIVALAHKASCAIGNDTGPMHLIGPTNCPAIVLFPAHGNPAKHAPNGANIHALQQDGLTPVSVQQVKKTFEHIENTILENAT
ncbi:MAG: glycosyltransferase family 9 protein [Alphaproteobacteria bacterium]